MYLLLKQTHVACVILSGCGFFLRGIAMLADSPLLEARWVRIAPHLVDTVLLASALWLAIEIRQYPFVAGWLTAKLIGLVLYIGLGMVALRRGRSKRVRLLAWLLALGAFAYIVSVALSHDPRGMFA